MSMPAAVAEWERLRAARDDGVVPVSKKAEARQKAAVAAAPGIYTVRQLCREYLAGHVERSRKPKGVTIVRNIFANMIEPIANLPAAEVTRAQAFDLIDGRNSTPVLGAKIRQELAAAWEYGIDSGRLDEKVPNWWSRILKGKLQTKGKPLQGKRITEKRVLSDEEVSELVRWLPNFSRTIADALTLYIWTGTRGAEIVGMEKGEITEEPDGLWWTVPKIKTKNARRATATDHRVPLIGRAEEIVRRRMLVAKTDFLFPSRTGSHIDQKVIQQAVYDRQPYCEGLKDWIRPRLPVTHWAPHDLRRTTRTKLASLGCPHEIAESILGHVLPGVAGVYNRHGYDKERREWLTLLSTRLEEIMVRRPA